MEKENLNNIMKKLSESISNGYSIEELYTLRKTLKQDYKEEKELVGYALNILTEVIRLKKKLKNSKNSSSFFKNLFLFIFFTALLFVVTASINYKINGDTKFSIGENETTIFNLLRGEQQLIVEESLSFRDLLNTETFSLYRALIGTHYTFVPDAFNNSLIFQTTKIINPYQMEICFWDNETQKMHFCINEGAPQRATTIRRSFQIVGNLTDKENDENFTLCEGTNYVDCSTDITGADLFVQDDIEAQSIYANENILALGNIYALSLGDSGSYIAELFATQINSETINATTINVEFISATNISTSNINADRIDATCICYDGGCLGTC